ncbi:MAG: DUF3341 domain-containing protein [Balneolales bacterium]|nr:DUF3341 domain-containing protein [Balneolales bacterium]
MDHNNAENKKVFAVLAEFENPGKLMKAAKLVSRAGYAKFDAHSPFPIHGMDDAMGLKESKLGWIVLSHALVGFSGGLALQVWASTYAYPINIGGRPFMNLPAFVPVTFELTILLSAFAAVFGMLFLNNLPKHHNSIFNSDNFNRVTDDKFFICVETDDPLYNEEETEKFFQDCGCVSYEKVYE